MNVTIDYGTSGLEVVLPDDIASVVIQPAFASSPEDPAAFVRAALRSPIGARPLGMTATRSSTVGIVFSDITRATPYNVILPPLLEELHSVGIPDSQIVLFNATGTHRANSRAELVQILGEEAVSRFRIVQNDCTDTSSHRYVGTTASGNRIELFSEFLDSDIRILTGFVEPHFFAGMSGGGKAIMPGLATLETVQANHSARHMDHDEVRWGVTEGNPLWEDVREAALLAGPTFLLNVAMNREKQVTAAFAGDLVAAHRNACEYVRSHAMVPVDAAFDIVIASNSGYPLDLNLYQSVKGMSAAAQVVKHGGHIIMAAECWDGVPEHGAFGKLLASAGSPQELLRQIRQPGFVAPDMWQAQILAKVCERATVHFYTDGLSEQELRSAFLAPCADIGERVRSLLGEMPGATVCVLPEGPLTIPYLRRRVG